MPAIRTNTSVKRVNTYDFAMTSVTPSCRASASWPGFAYPVMRMTGSARSVSRIARNTSIPLDRWQAKVKENGVRPVALEMAQPFLTGMGDGRLVALVGECARKQFGDQDVILDEKQLDWAPSLPPADIP